MSAIRSARAMHSNEGHLVVAFQQQRPHPEQRIVRQWQRPALPGRVERFRRPVADRLRRDACRYGGLLIVFRSRRARLNALSASLRLCRALSGAAGSRQASVAVAGRCAAATRCRAELAGAALPPAVLGRVVAPRRHYLSLSQVSWSPGRASRDPFGGRCKGRSLVDLPAQGAVITTGEGGNLGLLACGDPACYGHGLLAVWRFSMRCRAAIHPIHGRGECPGKQRESGVRCKRGGNAESLHAQGAANRGARPRISICPSG